MRKLESGETWPNKRGPGNGASTLLFHIRRFLRAVPDRALAICAQAVQTERRSTCGSLLV